MMEGREEVAVAVAVRNLKSAIFSQQ